MPHPSPFSSVPLAPPDPILGLNEAFTADVRGTKANLGVGVYLDDRGKVPILESVRIAQKRWIEQEDTKTYLPIDGVRAYNQQVQALMFGAGSDLMGSGRAVTVQGLGGTGALRIGADLLRRFPPGGDVWLTTPSWENHRALFEAAGHTVNQFPYYDPDSRDLDFAAMAGKLRQLGPGGIVVLHACCHNPSGVDLTAAQWHEVVRIAGDRNLVVFLDFAYQGFGDGLDEDALAVRAFAASGLPFLVANSFSKSFSLYRERVGALTVVTGSSDEAKNVLSQIKRVVRTNVSNPPSFGAQVVATVLADPELSELWRRELAAMRARIKRMRSRFADGLKARGVAGDFGFIERQKGMFSFLGLPVEAVRRLRSEHGIYAVDSSRVCVAAMNDSNLNFICDSIAAVVG